MKIGLPGVEVTLLHVLDNMERKALKLQDMSTVTLMLDLELNGIIAESFIRCAVGRKKTFSAMCHARMMRLSSFGLTRVVVVFYGSLQGCHFTSTRRQTFFQIDNNFFVWGGLFLQIC